MKAYEMVPTVQTAADFSRFVRALLKELDDNPDAWENDTLSAFLEAAASWTEDAQGTPLMPRDKAPDWRTFADILMAATMYE
jgi:hypothetical protein